MLLLDHDSLWSLGSAQKSEASQGASVGRGPWGSLLLDGLAHSPLPGILLQTMLGAQWGERRLGRSGCSLSPTSEASLGQGPVEGKECLSSVRHFHRWNLIVSPLPGGQVRRRMLILQIRRLQRRIRKPGACAALLKASPGPSFMAQAQSWPAGTVSPARAEGTLA